MENGNLTNNLVNVDKTYGRNASSHFEVNQDEKSSKSRQRVVLKIDGSAKNKNLRGNNSNIINLDKNSVFVDLQKKHNSLSPSEIRAEPWQQNKCSLHIQKRKDSRENNLSISNLNNNGNNFIGFEANSGDKLGVISNGSWSPHNNIGLNGRSPVANTLKTAHHHLIGHHHSKSGLDIKARFQELRNYNSSSKLVFSHKNDLARDQNSSYSFNNNLHKVNLKFPLDLKISIGTGQ